MKKVPQNNIVKLSISGIEGRGIEPRPQWLALDFADLVPCLGRIAAGIPIEAIEDRNREELLTLITKPGHYALKVSGDSMIDAGIYDGDIIIVRSQQQAKNGDIVVALLDNESVTLKRIRFVKTTHVELIADNSSYQNQIFAINRVTFQGKVIGQIRQYQ